MKKVRFSNCCEIIGGYAFDSKKMSSKEGTFQVIKMGNVYNGILDLLRNTSYISEPTNSELVSLLKEKDIIITLTGTVNKKDYGYSVQIENQKNLLLNQRCALIRSTNINDEYLFYLIKSKHFLDQFYSSSTGGTGNQTNVSIKAMEQFKVNIHSEEEQEKIAYLLKKIDLRITTQIKIIEELKIQKKYIIKSIFNNINADEMSLFDLSDVYQPQTISSNNLNPGGKYPVYGANGIIGYYTKYNHENEQICLTCRGASVGTLNFSSKFSWITGNSMVINTDDYNSLIDKEYLLYHLMIVDFNKYITGSGQPQITRDSLKKLKVFLPNLEVQNKIKNMCKSIDSHIRIESKILFEYNRQKQFLLSKKSSFAKRT